MTRGLGGAVRRDTGLFGATISPFKKGLLAPVVAWPYL